MNRKQLLILLVLVAVVGGAGLLLHQQSQTAWHSADKTMGRKLLGDNFPVNDLALIAIKQATDELDLARKDDLWRVRERNDYRPDSPRSANSCSRRRPEGRAEQDDE